MLAGEPLSLGTAVMPAPVSIRADRSPAELRRLAGEMPDRQLGARLAVLAIALEGVSRREAARLAGVTDQTLRDWVLRYNAHGIDGLRDHPRTGRPPAQDAKRQDLLLALARRWRELPDDGPMAVRIRDLCALAQDCFGRRYSETGMWRLLRGLALLPSGPPRATPARRIPCEAKRLPARPIPLPAAGGATETADRHQPA
jgi:transposase